MRPATNNAKPRSVSLQALTAPGGIGAKGCGTRLGAVRGGMGYDDGEDQTSRPWVSEACGLLMVRGIEVVRWEMNDAQSGQSNLCRIP